MSPADAQALDVLIVGMTIGVALSLPTLFALAVRDLYHHFKGGKR